MGNLSFIIKDPETAFNLYAIDKNPVDLIDYLQGKRLIQFINQIDYPEYYGYEGSNYTAPIARYLERLGDNLALGLVFNSRIIPHYYCIGIESKYSLRILTSLKLNKFYFGYGSRIKTLPNWTYHYIDQEPTLLLDLENVKFGIGYVHQARYNYYSFWESKKGFSYEIPVYFLTEFLNIEEFFMARHYSKRPDFWFSPDTANGYDIGNIIVYNYKIANVNLRSGLRMDYRKIEVSGFGWQSKSKFLNIIPGFAFTTKTIICGIEIIVAHSSNYQDWFVRPKFGFEIKVRKPFIQIGWAKIDEDWASQMFVDEYEMKEFHFSTEMCGTYYSLGICYPIGKNFYLEAGVNLSHFSKKIFKVNQSLSFKWRI